jgi:hypothetical protein
MEGFALNDIAAQISESEKCSNKRLVSVNPLENRVDSILKKFWVEMNQFGRETAMAKFEWL